MNILWKIAGVTVVTTAIVVGCSRFVFAAEPRVPAGTTFANKVLMCNTPTQVAMTVSLAEAEKQSLEEVVAAVGKTKAGMPRCSQAVWEFTFVKKVSEVTIGNRSYPIAEVLLTGLRHGTTRIVFNTPSTKYISYHFEKVNVDVDEADRDA